MSQSSRSRPPGQSPRLKDLVGQTFKAWTVVERSPDRKRKTRWLCRCVCGNLRDLDACTLTSGDSASCGCLSNRTRDLPAGTKFGRLTIITRAGSDRFKKKNWLCRCECGREITVSTSALTSGNTKSCGCLRDDVCGQAAKTHGMSKSSEYRIWALMIDRCTNPKNKKYADYGGRGIKVFEEWLNSFEAFFAHIGPRLFLKAEIDRIENDGDYRPGNVRWASCKEQCRNARDSHFITYQGRTQCIAAWAEELGISPGAIWKRIHRGCPPERIFAQRRLHRFN
jgi:hypothetical protein